MSELTNKELAEELQKHRYDVGRLPVTVSKLIGFAAERLAAMPDERVFSLDAYDAGSLNDFGGGNIDWWHDYIRSELGRAHDFYQSQLDDNS